MAWDDKNKVVEVDETYVGSKVKNHKNHVPKKAAVLSLVGPLVLRRRGHESVFQCPQCKNAFSTFGNYLKWPADAATP